MILQWVGIAKLYSIGDKKDMISRSSYVFLTVLLLIAAWSRADDVADIKAEITKRHDQAVKRLQDWIAQVSIAAENRGYPDGAEYMAKLAQDAGFQKADVIT